jgi:hypothetical protein
MALAQDDSPNHSGADFILRTTGSHRDLVANVQAAVAEVNPEIAIQFGVLTQRIKGTLLGDLAMLSGAVGLLAVLLAMLGLDGVISYMVAQQRNEIGLRMALGADRGSVIGLVMREAGFLLMIGLIAERPWRFERRVPPPLYIRPQTVRPATLVTPCAVLASIGMVADYAPGGSASRLDPMQALREE